MVFLQTFEMTRTFNPGTLFEKCLGQSFVVVAVESIEGVPCPLAKLDVGQGRAGISEVRKLLRLGFDSVASAIACG